MRGNELSIVVPVFNRENLVRPTLQALEAQTLRPLRVILVDNCSTDSTMSVLKEWAEKVSSPEFQVDVLSETSPGACAARNRGLSSVNSGIVSFIDSDDIPDPHYAGKILETFNSYPDTDLLVWRKSVRQSDGRRRILPRRFGDILKGQILHSAIATSTFAVRTAFLREAGGWNNLNIPCWQDWELGIRLLSFDPRIHFIDESLVTVCPTADSITGTRFADKAGKWEKVARGVLDGVSGPDKSRIGKLIRLRLAVLAGDYRKEGEKELSDSLLHELQRDAGSLTFSRRLAAMTKAVGAGVPGAATLLSTGI